MSMRHSFKHILFWDPKIISVFPDILNCVNKKKEHVSHTHKINIEMKMQLSKVVYFLLNSVQ